MRVELSLVDEMKSKIKVGTRVKILPPVNGECSYFKTGDVGVVCEKNALIYVDFTQTKRKHKVVGDGRWFVPDHRIKVLRY